MELAELYSQLGGVEQARRLGDSAIAAARSGGDSAAADDESRLREVGQQFEALFLEQVLKGMRRTIDRSHNPLRGGLAQDIFEDMLYREYALLMAKTGSLGIAELVYEELSGERG